MCYIWESGEDSKQKVTLDEKKRFIDSMHGFVESDFEFHLSGGEPLMDRDIFEIISHIRSHGFRTNMVTNGWLVDESTFLRLRDAGLNSLTFSVDGLKAETHDFLRGREGSHARIIEAVKLAEKMRRDMSVSFITLITNYNLKEILPLTDFVQNNPALEMISFQAITQPFSQPQDEKWHLKKENALLWPHDMGEMAVVLDELYRRRTAGCKIGNQANHFQAFKAYFKNPNKFLKRVKCNLGDYEFHVDPYGKVFFCNTVGAIGNIKTDSVPELWFKDSTRAIRKDVYTCRRNCHIMINCFYEEENTPSGIFANLKRMIGIGKK